MVTSVTKNIKLAFFLSFAVNIVFLIVNLTNIISAHRRFNYKHITYSYDRNSLYLLLPVKKTDFVFIGDSEIQNFDLMELLGSDNLKNRGIDGDVTMGVYNRLNEVLYFQPAKLFLEVGTNDIRLNIPVDTSLNYIEKTIKKCRENSPKTIVYVLSVLPTGTDHNNLILEFNKKERFLCNKYNIGYVDIYSKFVYNGLLKKEYDCGDGYHLSGDGYLAMAEILKPYI